MALREFRDANGIEWRVWATIPEASALIRVDYGPLGGLEAGWLTFECSEGRKRLAPFPSDWDTLSDADLERWCVEAKAPPPRRSNRPVASGGGDPAPRAAMELSPLDPASPARTFTGASGRLWRVSEHECPVHLALDDSGAERTVTHFVLRFSSESEVLELRTYPMAWSRLTDDQLLRLARQAVLVNPADAGDLHRSPGSAPGIR